MNQSASPAAGCSRRRFLRTTLLTGAVLTTAPTLSRAAAGPSHAGGPLPKRVLGRTGVQVTILGLGTAPIGEARIDAKEAERIFGEVMDSGVNYIDTARGYGIAEEVLGNLVPARRDKLFLVTKVWTDNAAEAEKSLTQSLRLLKVDHVDLVHIHHLGGKNLDRVLAKDGVLEYLLKQKEAGKLRFIGMSGHANPWKYVKMLETQQMDVMMTVMNYADRHIYGFEEKVLPQCRQQNVGVVAMKVYAGIKGGFPNHRKGWVGCNTPPERLAQAMAYALDLPGVSSAVIGPFTLEQARHNLALARQYKPLTDTEREDLLKFGRELAPTLGPRYGPVDERQRQGQG